MQSVQQEFVKNVMGLLTPEQKQVIMEKQKAAMQKANEKKAEEKKPEEK
jgi:Spy/CpxP family protein refolding chaperone